MKHVSANFKGLTIRVFPKREIKIGIIKEKCFENPQIFGK